jgi:cytochrome b
VGFIGPRHARFQDFVYRPAVVFRYLGDMVRGRGNRYVGHSPAGGIMVLALLACIAGTVGTGLVAYGEQGRGPLAGMRSSTIATINAEPDEGGQPPRSGHEESVVAGLHALLANVTLTLVLLHLLGVVVASLAHRENLVGAMITGEKHARE